MTQTLLALDTSTPACSVALCHRGQIHQRLLLEERQHSRVLLPLVDELLAEAGLGLTALDGLICTSGPGAFTGLRVGAAMASGLAAALQRPLYPLSSLALLAASGRARLGPLPLLAVLNAQMGEIYAGLYGADGRCLEPDWLGRPEALPPAYQRAEWAVGSGTVYPLPLPGQMLVPEAQHAFALPLPPALAPNEALPLNYLRNSVV